MTDTDIAGQGHSPIPSDIAVTVAMVPTEAIPGHKIETVDITIRILCDALTPILSIPATTLHITHHLPIGVLSTYSQGQSRS